MRQKRHLWINKQQNGAKYCPVPFHDLLFGHDVPIDDI
uniref:Uncharacterized protein n=1 Tax=Yersinia ruckeri TaxID=29486 RepID=A0A0A8VF55_YERRU|nr:hypothetical protein CSF007_4195 [Yersinia ruckeri]